MNTNPAIIEAIRLSGTETKLALLTGYSQAAINKVKRGRWRVSAEMAIAIEKATDGQVSRSKLRPDLWPEAA